MNHTTLSTMHQTLLDMVRILSVSKLRMTSRILCAWFLLSGSMCMAYEDDEQVVILLDAQDEDGMTPLMHAIQEDDFNIIEYYIQQGANLEIKDVNGETALTYAISYKNFDVIKLLIDNGADVNAQNKNEWTALMKAVNNGNNKIAQLLIDSGAYLYMQDEYFWSAFTIAIDRGNVDMMKSLIDAGVNINRRYKDGSTALMLVIENRIEFVVHENDATAEPKLLYVPKNNKHEMVQFCIDAGIRIDCQNMHGVTAFMIASQNNDVAIMQTLIEHGVDLNIQDNHGQTAFIKAVDKGHLQAAQLLIQQGVDVNVQDHNSWTALIFASLDMTMHEEGEFSVMIRKEPDHHKMQILDMLLQHEVDINLQDNNGMTVVMHLAKYGNYQVLQKLLDHGADISLQDYTGLTACMYAVKNNIAHAMQAIMDLHIQNNENTDMIIQLVYIIKNNKFQMIKLLVEHGACLDDFDIVDGLTALMHATKYSEYRTMELLIHAHAKITLQDRDGLTALMIAADQGDKKSVQIIVDGYASNIVDVIKMKNNEGKTALDLAFMQGHHDIVELLQSCIPKAWYEFWK